MKKVEKPIFSYEIGDAILEDSALCSLLNDFSNISDSEILHNISDISRTLEALIMNERVFVFSYHIDNKKNTEAYYYTNNPLPLVSIINELTREKILFFVSILPKNSIPKPSRLLNQIERLGIFSLKELNNINTHNFSSFLYQQEIARRYSIPFYCSDRSYTRKYLNKTNLLKFSLSQQLLKEINFSISEDMKYLLQTTSNIKYFIPPIMALTLEKVSKGASFGEAILEMRTTCKPLREQFKKYNYEFINNTRSLSEQIKTSKIIAKDIRKLASSFQKLEGSTLTVWGDIFDFVFSNASEMETITPLSAIGLVSKLGILSKDIIELLVLKRRYSSVYKIRSDFFNLADYSSLLINTMTPYQQRAKDIFPNGYLCISPGNPFGSISDL